MKGGRESVLSREECNPLNRGNQAKEEEVKVG